MLIAVQVQIKGVFGKDFACSVGRLTHQILLAYSVVVVGWKNLERLVGSKRKCLRLENDRLEFCGRTPTLQRYSKSVRR